MTDRAELIEKMAAAIQIAQAGSSFGDTLRNIASDLADLALEEAARICDPKGDCSEMDAYGRVYAAAIRALKSRA